MTKMHSFLLKQSYNLTKLKEKKRRSSISHYLFKKQTLLKVKTTIIFRVKNKYNYSKLFRQPFGPKNSELWCELFCPLVNIRKLDFKKKIDRLITIRNIFSTVTVQN